jgi:hypothetical protein
MRASPPPPAQAPPFDIVVDGQTPGGDARAVEKVRPYAEAGATWWIETMWDEHELEPVKKRILQGPPWI